MLMCYFSNCHFVALLIPEKCACRFCEPHVLHRARQDESTSKDFRLVWREGVIHEKTMCACVRAVRGIAFECLPPDPPPPPPPAPPPVARAIIAPAAPPTP